MRTEAEIIDMRDQLERRNLSTGLDDTDATTLAALRWVCDPLVGDRMLNEGIEYDDSKITLVALRVGGYLDALNGGEELISAVGVRRLLVSDLRALLEVVK